MLTNHELTTMLADCRRNGVLSVKLLRAVERIARRFLSQGWVARCDVAFVADNVLLKFCDIWLRLDPAKNIFAYITAMAKNEAKMFRRSERIRKRLFDEFDFDGDWQCSSCQFKTRVVRAVCC